MSQSFDRDRKALKLFEEWIALNPESREGFWRRVQAQETESLIAELRELIAADEGEFPAFDAFNVAFHTDEADPQAPTICGPFHLQEKIGVGGMGVVYAATQPELDRQVAVKLLRAPFPSQELSRRFLAEARALARLDHPGIARIFDAGVETNGGEAPWIAMELVRGQPLDNYCKEKGLDREGKLRLFAEICDAVEHAHQRGLVHRDLKPSNLFVSQGGVPKILDFGIARFLDHSEASRTFTLSGQVLGTLAYMSPEQAAGANDRLGPASDVYSLGVVLYELLVEQRPHDLDGLTLTEALRKIQEVNPPRLSRLDAGLAGDLEVVVARALSREPQDRFQTAAGLGAELRRYLRGEPVLSRPPSFLRTMRGIARRHRALCATAAAGILGLIIATFFALRFAHAAEKERLAEDLARKSAQRQIEVAKRETRTTNSLLEFLESALSELDPNSASMAEPTLAIALDSVAEKLPKIAEEPAVQARLQVMMARIYGGLGAYSKASELVEAALPQIDDFEQKGELNACYQDAAWFALKLGNTSRATAHVSSARAMLEEMEEGAKAESPRLLRLEGEVAFYANDFSLAIAKSQEAIAALKALGDPDHEEIANAKITLASVALAQSDDERALQLNEEILAHRQKIYRPDHPYVAEALHNLGFVHYQLRDPDRAFELLSEAMAIRAKSMSQSHPTMVEGRYVLGVIENMRGRWAEAKGYFVDVKDDFERLYRVSDPQKFADFAWQLALANDYLGDIEAAIPNFEIALSLYEEAGNLEEPNWTQCSRDFVVALLVARRNEAAWIAADRAYRSACTRIPASKDVQQELRLWRLIALSRHRRGEEALKEVLAMAAEDYSGSDPIRRITYETEILFYHAWNIMPQKDEDAQAILLKARAQLYDAEGTRLLPQSSDDPELRILSLLMEIAERRGDSDSLNRWSKEMAALKGQ